MENPKLEDLYQAFGNHIPQEFQKEKAFAFTALDDAIKARFKNPSELEWYLNFILSYNYFLNRLVNDMLFLSRIDRNIFPTDRPAINLATDFRQPINQHIQYYRNKELKIRILVQHGIEVLAPPFEFTLALMHLFDNACKLSPTYGTIIVYLTGIGASGCILTVVDQGEGISASNRPKAFERNMFIHPTATRNIALGVGLPIVRYVAQRLGGDAYILESSKGCGVQMVIPAK